MAEKHYSIENASVADLTDTVGSRDLPLVGPDAGVSEIIAAFDRARHARLIYVVDTKQHILGVISLGNVAKHLLFHLNETAIDNLHLVNMALAERAEDYIDRPTIYARPADNIDQILKKMLKAGIKEVPVIDSTGKLVADLTLVDIFKYCGIS